MIITIDGPSGTGKSTVAQQVAKELGFTFLDTGALYRSLAYAMHLQNIHFEDEKSVASFISENPLDILCDQGSSSYCVGGQNVTDAIRSEIATKGSSIISKHSCVRSYLLPIQRSFAHHQNIVCEGRDMGTTVFPQADVKIYLDADPEIRAQRRFLEKKTDESFETILKSIIERDTRDASRALSPLRQAEDAFIIDTSALSLQEVVKKVLDIVHKTPHCELFTHKADIGIRGVGRNLSEAFEQTARALTSVITPPENVKALKTVSFTCQSEDPETLLFDFLNRVIYEMAVNHMLFSNFAVHITNGLLNASISGEHIADKRHQPAVEVKAATYYELLVRRKSNGLFLAQCIVDV